MSAVYRVVLADDHPVALAGLRSYLDHLPDLDIVALAGNASEVKDRLTSADADVLVVDLGMPGMRGAASIRAFSQRVPTVVFSQFADPAIRDEMTRAGAAAVLPKTGELDALVRAIRLAAGAGDGRRAAETVKPDLTQRETEVAALVASGVEPEAIAAELGLSLRTIHAYLRRLREKLGADSTAGIRVVARRLLEAEAPAEAPESVPASSVSTQAPLSAPLLEELAALWETSARRMVADTNDGWRFTIERLSHLLGAGGGGFAIMATRAGEAESTFAGWRFVAMLDHGEGAERRAAIQRDWRERKANWATDKAVRTLFDEAGHAASRSVDLAPSDDEMRESLSREIIEAHGLCDRMIGVHEVEPGTRVLFGFDRTIERGPFSETDRSLLLAAVTGLTQSCRWLAITHGIFPARGGRKLSPRERETLGHLLGGESEKEIADTLGLRKASLHQVVVAVYRKLGVRSRAELVSLVLGT